MCCTVDVRLFACLLACFLLLAGFFTITLVSTVPGLSVLDRACGQWVAAESLGEAPCDILIFGCESLERLTQPELANVVVPTKDISTDEATEPCATEQVIDDEIFAPAIRNPVWVPNLEPTLVRAALHRVEKCAGKDEDEGQPRPRLSLVYELRSEYDGL